MSNLIKIRRGLAADLPVLSDGELGFTTDTKKLYVGNSGTNALIGDFSVTELPTSFAADKMYAGKVITGTAGEVLTIGNFVYYDFATKKWKKANASTYATARCKGVVVESISTDSTGLILIEGTMRLDIWSWTAADVWLSTTSGQGSSTQPSTTGNQLQHLALALAANILYVNPSNDIGEVPE